jgi:integrase
LLIGIAIHCLTHSSNGSGAVYHNAFHQGADVCQIYQGQKITKTVTPVLGEKAGHNIKVVYSLDFQVTPHQLRHTYITNLIYASVDPKTVQYLAGHENSKITMDIYAKVKYNKPHQLLPIINGAFSQNKENPPRYRRVKIRAKLV